MHASRCLLSPLISEPAKKTWGSEIDRLVEHFQSPVCLTVLASAYANNTSTVTPVAATAKSPSAIRSKR
jgi:hypothetical protein